MRRVLLVLLGLLLLLLLSYICFSSKDDFIRKDLVSKVNNLYKSKQMEWVKADLQGDGLGLTAIMTLRGTAPNIEAKNEAEKIALSVNGVQGVNNLLVVKKVVVPSPYVLNVIKNKNGSVILRGYVPNIDVHEEIVYLANQLFTKEKVIDELKEIEGAPNEWQDIALFGLQNLHSIDYGQFSLSDNNFSFEGYVESNTLKDEITSKIENKFDNFSKNIDLIVPALSKQAEIFNCQQQFDLLLSNNKIHFEYDKAELKSESFELLDKLIKVAKKCPDSVITIEGHTDSTGSEVYNQMLSQKRAIAVKNYLQNNGLIDIKLEAIGYGEKKPIASNKTVEGRLKNRRIELKVREEK